MWPWGQDEPESSQDLIQSMWAKVYSRRDDMSAESSKQNYHTEVVEKRVPGRGSIKRQEKMHAF
jgi:hypothetical protein